MDTTTIATIAGATVSLLVSYLRSLGERFADNAGEEIVAKAGEAAWGKAKQLWERVKAVLASKPEAMKAIDALESNPDNEDTQVSIRSQLEGAMASDERFAEELASLLKEASDTGADTVFDATIVGSVKKLVQMGNVFGDVKI